LYSGVAELGSITDEQIAQLYQGDTEFKLYKNQYVIFTKPNNETVTGKWNGENLEDIHFSPIKNNAFGVFAPRNIEQELAFSAMQDESLTGVLLTGGFGSGKSIISLVHALDFVTRSKKPYKSVIFLRNNQITKNTNDVGALPDSLTAKLKPFAMMLADIIGDEAGLDRLITEKKVILEHIGFIRGRSFKNSIVYVSEGQNLTREQISIIISRIGEGSRLFIEGDVKQWDKEVFNKDSGIIAMAESLKGDEEFAMITLKKNERSRFASLSDKVLDYKI
jgi:PhoH-like ATPase